MKKKTKQNKQTYKQKKKVERYEREREREREECEQGKKSGICGQINARHFHRCIVAAAG
jgi:hypothetical protein